MNSSTSPEYISWPIGGVDETLSDLQARYYPDLAHIDIPGMICDSALGEIAIVSSFGAESAALLHYINEIRPRTPVLFLDTGKHFPETLQYRDELTKLLDLDLRVIQPNADELLSEDPTGDLHKHDPSACCALRKTFPLQDALSPFNSWISGRKRYQSGSRSNIPIIERDGEKIKLNPLAIWKKGDVESYFERYQLPHHPLEAEGFLSIGCAPCTLPVADGADPRAGRWTQMPDKTECGIHLGPGGKFTRSGA